MVSGCSRGGIFAGSGYFWVYKGGLKDGNVDFSGDKVELGGRVVAVKG